MSKTTNETNSVGDCGKKTEARFSRGDEKALKFHLQNIHRQSRNKYSAVKHAVFKHFALRMECRGYRSYKNKCEHGDDGAECRGNIDKKRKRRFAFSSSFSPRVLATMALPPVSNIKPAVPSIIRKGYMKFTAAKGVFPT